MNIEQVSCKSENVLFLLAWYEMQLSHKLYWQFLFNLFQNGMKLHYENNNPFLAVTKLMRVIEVSHWGNIAVEEHIEIRHTGAKLKGSFSRYDYQRQPNSGASSVKSFKTILPASAADVYYRLV